MSKTTRYVILIVDALGFLMIGGAIQDSTGSEAAVPLLLIPVSILWIILFPINKKE